MANLRAFLTSLLLAGIVVMAQAPSAGAQALADAALIINEIHYDPADKTAHAEYVEIYNPGSAAVDLTGWALTRAVRYQFPDGARVPAGGYLVVAQNPASVRRLYGAAALGPFTGSLSADGDDVILRDAGGSDVDRVQYGFGFPWPTAGGDSDTSMQLINPSLDNSRPGAWRSNPPTPGRSNAGMVSNAPPQIDQVEHTPQAPTSHDAVTVRAHITDPDGVAGVRLLFQPVMPGRYIRLNDPEYQDQWLAVSMAAVGGDDYAAEIPPQYRVHRALIRYRIEALDGAGNRMVAPYADDPQPNFALFIYDGAPPWEGAIQPGLWGPVGRRNVYDFNQMRPLPIYQLLATAKDVEDAQFIPNSQRSLGYMGNDFLWRGTFVYNGVVYDHIGFRARGGEFRYSVGKNHWQFAFNRGHEFQAYDDFGVPYAVKWRKMSFSSVMQHANRHFRGEQGMFESMSYRLFNLAGVATSATHFVHFRVVDQPWETGANQYDNDFWGLYLAIQFMDGRFLKQNNLPDGNLYEMTDWTGESDHQSADGVADGSDLRDFVANYRAGRDADWWRANFNLDGYYSYRSIVEAVHDYDLDQGKNYDYYLNPQTKRWSILPWDTDLTWSEEMFGLGNEPFRDRVLPIPEFNLPYQNRLRELRDLLFNPGELYPMLDEFANVIDTPSGGLSMVAADRARWDYNPVLNSRYVDHQRSRTGRYYLAAPKTGFRGMVQLMKDYIVRRAAWIDSSLLTDKAIPVTPSIAYAGSAGWPADQLVFQSSGFSTPQGGQTFAAMQWRAAEIRRPGLPGYIPNTRSTYEIQATWVSPELTAFNSTLALPQGACQPGVLCRVRVRMKDSSGRWSHWSAPAEFVAGPPVLAPARDLQISEIMYHPGADAGAAGDDLEFLELTNSGSRSIDLSNVHFTDGIDYRFPAGASLAPGRYWVLAADAPSFQARYGFAPDGEYQKQLSNQGEKITLVDAFGRQILSVGYQDGKDWPPADGSGRSLVWMGGSGADGSAPAGWRASTAIGGSPGADDPAPVLVNEIQLDPANGHYAAIELFNPSRFTAQIGGWILTDAANLPALTPGRALSGWQIPAGSQVPPGGYLVLTPDGAQLLKLDGEAGALALLSTRPDGRYSGYQHRVAFSLPAAGSAVGRYVSSDGAEHFTGLQGLTPGAANLPPQVGPVVISGFMVQPPDGLQWIELANITDHPVDLFDQADPLRTWLIAGVIFQFPSGLTIPAQGRLLITSGDPSTVCLNGSLPAGLRATGPFPLPLAGSGMPLTLLQPIQWAGSYAGGAVDRVNYRLSAPWPSGGAPGTAFLRNDLAAFGDDPANWRTATAGADNPTPPAALDDVQLCAFDVFVNAEHHYEVRWVVTGQSDIQEFQLLRSAASHPDQMELIGAQAPVQASTSVKPSLYSWVDLSADPGQTYFYRLVAVNSDSSQHELAFTTPRARFYAVNMPVTPR